MIFLDIIVRIIYIFDLLYNKSEAFHLLHIDYLLSPIIGPRSAQAGTMNLVEYLKQNWKTNKVHTKNDI